MIVEDKESVHAMEIKTPATHHEALKIIVKLHGVDRDASASILKESERIEKSEYVTAFMEVVSDLKAVAQLVTTPAFLGKVFSDRAAAKDDLRAACSPSASYRDFTENLMLGIARYVEKHPDVAAAVSFTQREKELLTNSMTRFTQSQYPYAQQIKKDPACSL